MMLARGPWFALDTAGDAGGITAIAGSTTGAWATIARGEATLRDRDRVVARLAIPPGHDGPVALDGGVLAIGAQRHDLAARAWLPAPALDELLLGRIRDVHSTAEADQLRTEVAAWSGDRLFAQLRLRPPRDDRRWNAGAPDRWLIALDGERLVVLASGRTALAARQLAVADGQCVASLARTTLWSRALVPRALTAEPAAACAFADRGRAVCAVTPAGAVVSWELASPGGTLRSHGEPGDGVDALAGHPALPVIAWQRGRRLTVAALGAEAFAEVALEDDAVLAGWDAVEPVVLVATGGRLVGWTWSAALPG